MESSLRRAETLFGGLGAVGERLARKFSRFSNLSEFAAGIFFKLASLSKKRSSASDFFAKLQPSASLQRLQARVILSTEGTEATSDVDFSFVGRTSKDAELPQK